MSNTVTTITTAATVTAGPTAWDLRRNVRRLVLELGPALLLFVGTSIRDIYVGTVLLIVASALSTAWSWTRERRIPLVPLASLVSVGLIGGLTLVMADPRFVKMEPTISNSAGALALIVALRLRKLPLRSVFGAGTRARPRAWRHLTVALAGFLVVLSLLNEVVWRSVDTDTWAAFKAFALPTLNVLFVAVAFVWLKRNALRY